MAFVTNRAEVPITTLADGTAICIINPWFPINAAFSANANILPFVTVAAGSSTLPFAATTPHYAPAGPFNSIVNSISTFVTDSVSLDFIET